MLSAMMCMMWDLCTSALLFCRPGNSLFSCSPRRVAEQKKNQAESQAVPLGWPKNREVKFSVGGLRYLLSAEQALGELLSPLPDVHVTVTCVLLLLLHMQRQPLPLVRPVCESLMQTRGRGEGRDRIHPHVNTVLSPTEAYCGVFAGPCRPE